IIILEINDTKILHRNDLSRFEIRGPLSLHYLQQVCKIDYLETLKEWRKQGIVQNEEELLKKKKLDPIPKHSKIIEMKPIGFVTSATYSLLRGQSYGIGFITKEALLSTTGAANRTIIVIIICV
ncbi:hypothetical protein ABK040_014595, partial [Willaertia magna]